MSDQIRPEAKKKSKLKRLGIVLLPVAVATIALVSGAYFLYNHTRPIPLPYNAEDEWQFEWSDDDSSSSDYGKILWTKAARSDLPNGIHTSVSHVNDDGNIESVLFVFMAKYPFYYKMIRPLFEWNISVDYGGSGVGIGFPTPSHYMELYGLEKEPTKVTVTVYYLQHFNKQLYFAPWEDTMTEELLSRCTLLWEGEMPLT